MIYVFSYFKNADYVITDTFHGTVFSIKMNTKFCTLIRDSNRNKLEALLKKLDKLDRKVEKMEDIEHLTNDIKRAYNIIINEWIEYLIYLKNNYPYLYVSAVTINPFLSGFTTAGNKRFM